MTTSEQLNNFITPPHEASLCSQRKVPCALLVTIVCSQQGNGGEVVHSE